MSKGWGVGVVRVLVAVTSATLVGSLMGAPAQAVAPVPTASVALPADLDRASFYEAQTLCDPVARPGTLALQDLLLATYGPATIYIPRGCTSSTSEHFDGRALDWMRNARVPAEKEMADAFVDWLLAPAADGTPHEMARRMGIMYIIWNNRMIRMYDPGRGWTDYRSCLSSANAGTSMDTSCHRNHVHLSMSWDGAAGITSWWTGVAQLQPFCSSASSSAVPGTGVPSVVADPATLEGFVSVKPYTILDTRAGSGAGLTATCRALAGRSLYPKVGLAGGPVPSGVTSAVVRVTSASNAPALLSAWSSGASRPSGQVVTPMGTTTATIVVPIASDGSIGLSTSLGAANLTARVIGFTSGAGSPVVVPTTAPPPPTAAPEPTVVSRPTKPRKVRTKALSRAVRTKWKAPWADGGAPVLQYRVEALKSKKSGAGVAGTCSAEPTVLKCRIKGLKKRKKYYWMSVSVQNEAGWTWAPRKKVRYL
jgi:hypothetical protein